MATKTSVAQKAPAKKAPAKQAVATKATTKKVIPPFDDGKPTKPINQS